MWATQFHFFLENTAAMAGTAVTADSLHISHDLITLTAEVHAYTRNAQGGGSVSAEAGTKAEIIV